MHKRKSEEEIYKATVARIQRWRHNSFFGFCGMGRANMNSIMDSATATSAAKAKASAINIALAELAKLLKERVDG